MYPYLPQSDPDPLPTRVGLATIANFVFLITIRRKTGKYNLYGFLNDLVKTILTRMD